jgi:hypothetical protein
MLSDAPAAADQVGEETDSSDDELMAELSAQMEPPPRPSSRSSSKPSSSSSAAEGLHDAAAEGLHDATLATFMELTGVSHEQSFDALAASGGILTTALETHYRRNPPTAKRSNTTGDSDGPCRLLALPEELVRRCIRFVSMAHLIGTLRLVNKLFASLALIEARERVRSQVEVALVTGFEAETAGGGGGGGGGGDGSGGGSGSGGGGGCSGVVARPGTSTAGAYSSGGGGGGGGGSSGGSGGNSASGSAPVGRGGSSGKRAVTHPLPADKLRHLSRLSGALEEALMRFVASNQEGGRSTGIARLTSKCRSICFNLSDAKNPELRARLLRGELTPAALVRLSSQEMASGSLRAQRDIWHANAIARRIRYARPAPPSPA